MVLFSSCPFKIQKEKWPDLQLTRTDYLGLVLTPVRTGWTIPLRMVVLSKTTTSSSTSKVVQGFKINDRVWDWYTTDSAYAGSENKQMLVLEPHHMRGLRSPQDLIVLGTMSYPLALEPAVCEDHVASDSLWVPDSRQQLSNSNTSVNFKAKLKII
jgi:hypothetical protein